MASILVGTANGLHTYDAAGAAGPPRLDGHDVRAVAPESWQRLWAIVDRTEIWRAAEDGAWRRVASLADVDGGAGLEAICLGDTRANQEGGMLVGTSAAHLFRIGADFHVERVAGFD